jgi:hypothetical protein
MQRSLTQLGHTSVLALVAAAGVALSAAPTIAQPHALVAAIAPPHAPPPIGSTSPTPPPSSTVALTLSAPPQALRSPSSSTATLSAQSPTPAPTREARWAKARSSTAA